MATSSSSIDTICAEGSAGGSPRDGEPKRSQSMSIITYRSFGDEDSPRSPRMNSLRGSSSATTPRSIPPAWSVFGSEEKVEKVATQSLQLKSSKPDSTKETIQASSADSSSKQRKKISRNLSPIEIIYWVKRHKHSPSVSQALKTIDEPAVLEDPLAAYQALCLLRNSCVLNVSTEEQKINTSVLRKILQGIRGLLDRDKGVLERIKKKATELYHQRTALTHLQAIHKHDQEVIAHEVPMLLLKYGQLVGDDFVNQNPHLLSHWTAVPTSSAEWRVDKLKDDSLSRLDMHLLIQGIIRSCREISMMLDSEQLQQDLRHALDGQESLKDLFNLWIAEEAKTIFFALPSRIKEALHTALFNQYFRAPTDQERFLETYRMLTQIRQSVAFGALEGDASAETTQFMQALYDRALRALKHLKPDPADFRESISIQVEKFLNKRKSLESSKARRAADHEVFSLNIPVLNLAYLSRLGRDPVDSIFSKVMSTIKGEVLVWEWDLDLGLEHSLCPIIYLHFNRYLDLCREAMSRIDTRSPTSAKRKQWLANNATHMNAQIARFKSAPAYRAFCKQIPKFIDRALAERETHRDPWAYDQMILQLGDPSVTMQYLARLPVAAWKERGAGGRPPLIALVVGTHARLRTLHELTRQALKTDQFLRDSSSIPVNIVSLVLRQSRPLQAMVSSFFSSCFPSDNKKAKRLLILEKALKQTGVESKSLTKVMKENEPAYVKWVAHSILQLLHELRTQKDSYAIDLLRKIHNTLAKDAPGRTQVLLFLYGICPLMQTTGFAKLKSTDASLSSPRRQLLTQFLKTLQGFVNIAFDPKCQAVDQAEIQALFKYKQTTQLIKRLQQVMGELLGS